MEWLIGGAEDAAGDTLLHRMIVGAMRSAADAHNNGERPVWIGSAAKRAVQDIRAEVRKREGDAP